MKTQFGTLLALSLAATPVLAGMFSDEGTKVTEVSIESMVPHCAKPAASVSVGALTCMASGCANKGNAGGNAALGGMAAFLGMAAAASGTPLVDFSSVGAGMGNALTTALKATNCFDIQEREAMEALQKELALTGVKLEAQAADFMISGAITSVGVETSKSSFGAGMIPILGSISKSSQKANLAMDIRVIDVKKAKVLASKSFAADNEASSWGVTGGGLFIGGMGGLSGLFGSHSFSKSPEMDKVAAETVLYATNYLVNTLASNAVVSRPEPPKKPEPAQGAAQPSSMLD